MGDINGLDTAERSIHEEELEFMRVHGGTEFGDVAYEPVARHRYGADESTRGRVTSQRDGFTLTLAQDARSRQTAQRRDAAVARGLKRAESYIRADDADAVSYALTLTPTDAL